MSGPCAVALHPLPVVGIVGPSGAGKTTLLCRLLPQLAAAGLRVAVIKQASARFDLDTPGRDSDRLRRAGLARTLVAAIGQTVLIDERRPEADACDLTEALGWLDAAALDLVLVEGFAQAPVPKLEVLRATGPMRHQYRHDPWVQALLADPAPPADARLPWFALADVDAITGWLCRYRDDFPDRRGVRADAAARCGES